jgi:hypothetical protein
MLIKNNRLIIILVNIIADKNKNKNLKISKKIIYQ